MGELYDKITSKMDGVTSRANCVRVELRKNEQGKRQFWAVTTDADCDELCDYNYQRVELSEAERLEVVERMNGCGCVYIFSKEYLELY